MTRAMHRALFLSLPSLASGLTASWQPVGKKISPPRSGPTAAADEQAVWLFGGYAEPEGAARDVVDDFTGSAEMVNGSRFKLPAGTGAALIDQDRACVGFSCTQRRAALIWGLGPSEAGTGGIILDDVWSLDSPSQVWRKESAPMPRGPTSRHVACRVGTQLVVHTFRCADSVLCGTPKLGCAA